MDFEKKYNDALGWMRTVYPTLSGASKEDAEHYFPELQDSEDERIRNNLVNFLLQVAGGRAGSMPSTVQCQDWIAWIERQNPTDPDAKMNHPLYLEGFDVGKQAGEVLKERKPVEWSEEDEEHRQWILECLSDGERKVPEYAEQYQAAFNWLKSLRLQSHWKPSEKQMKVLCKANPVNLLSEEIAIYQSLYNDLKKL